MKECILSYHSLSIFFPLQRCIHHETQSKRRYLCFDFFILMTHEVPYLSIIVLNIFFSLSNGKSPILCSSLVHFFFYCSISILSSFFQLLYLTFFFLFFFVFGYEECACQRHPVMPSNSHATTLIICLSKARILDNSLNCFSGSRHV